MLAKLHISSEREIVSICDENLIGKKFETEDLQIDVTERFYKGEKVDEKQLLAIVKDVNSINAVGKDSIKFLLDNKFIEKENIIKIGNIPHAIVILK